MKKKNHVAQTLKNQKKMKGNVTAQKRKRKKKKKKRKEKKNKTNKKGNKASCCRLGEKEKKT